MYCPVLPFLALILAVTAPAAAVEDHDFEFTTAAAAAAPPPPAAGFATAMTSATRATTIAAATTTANPVVGHSTEIHPHPRNHTNYRRIGYFNDKVVPEPPGRIYGVYVCEHSNWTGNCVWQRFREMVCMGLPISDDLIMGPDVGIQCMAWVEPNCKGKATAGEIVSPGYSNFKKIWDLPKNPVSYMCKKCANTPDCGKPGVFVPFWDPPSCVYPVCDNR